MIGNADTCRLPDDPATFACVTANALISKADDAMTQVTQDSGPTLRGHSRKREDDTAAERTSDDCDRKTAVATARAVPNDLLRSAQPLDSKRCDRKRPHRPQEKTVGLLCGPAGAARRHPWREPASARSTALPDRCSGLPDPMPRIPCSGARSSLIVSLVRAVRRPQEPCSTALSRSRQRIGRGIAVSSCTRAQHIIGQNGVPSPARSRGVDRSRKLMAGSAITAEVTPPLAEVTPPPVARSRRKSHGSAGRLTGGHATLGSPHNPREERIFA